MKLLPMNQKNKWIIKYENKLEGMLSFNLSSKLVEELVAGSVEALMYLVIKSDLLEIP